MSKSPTYGFQQERLTLPLDRILPVRLMKEGGKGASRYHAIVASIREVGVIEPLMVFPQKGNPGYYLLMDGHMRLSACRELGCLEVECLISLEDESYTYNARISRVAPIQEKHMIMKAIESGVPIERIASALHLDVKDIRARIKVTDGISPEVVEMLNDKHMRLDSLRLLRKVIEPRQIEIAELMVSANNYSKPYIEALIFGTPKEKLSSGSKKTAKKIKPEDIARMEMEMESLAKEYKVCEQDFSSNMLQLTVFRRYVIRLLENPKIDRFLSSRYSELHTELSLIAASETVC